MDLNNEQEHQYAINRVRISDAMDSEDVDVLRRVLDERLPIGDYSLGIFLGRAKNRDIAQMLIDYGADVNQKMVGKFPLHAIDKMPDQVAALLLEQGANPNAVDKINGLTPLHIAVDGVDCDIEKVKLLLAHGADPSTETREGCTALQLAEHNQEALSLLSRQEKIICLLRKNRVPNITMLLRNREMFGSVRNPYENFEEYPEGFKKNLGKRKGRDT
jgi:hypothetical protein